MSTTITMTMTRSAAAVITIITTMMTMRTSMSTTITMTMTRSAAAVIITMTMMTTRMSTSIIIMTASAAVVIITITTMTMMPMRYSQAGVLRQTARSQRRNSSPCYRSLLILRNTVRFSVQRECSRMQTEPGTTLISFRRRRKSAQALRSTQVKCA